MKKKDGALHASWKGLENVVYPEAALPMWAAALGDFPFVVLFCFFVFFFFFFGRCLYGNVIFNSLKTYPSGVNSSFEVTIFCVMLSGHFDSK